MGKKGRCRAGHALWSCPVALLLIAQCWLLLLSSGRRWSACAQDVVVKGDTFQVRGHQDEDLPIQLRAQFDIPDGEQILLPISVQHGDIAVNGSAPPRLKSVTSTTVDHTYGVGEEIPIVLTFSSNVTVYGTPRLEMLTGCHTDECLVKEVQSFTCLADYGAFSITLGETHIRNIGVETRQDELKYKLEEVPGVESVTVHYGTGDDREYSGGNRICTAVGNEVTVTFDDISWTDVDGDIPEMLCEELNNPIQARTQTELGDGTRLSARAADTDASVTATAVEVTQGRKYDNRFATYLSGNTTSQLVFLYTVQAGDASSDLDLVEVELDTLSNAATAIVSSATGEDADVSLPPSGYRGRFMTEVASSLSFNSDIVIDTSTPTVSHVWSSTADGNYGVGDRIFIKVVFTQDVTISGSPVLRLETGAIDEIGEVYSVIGPVVTFLYTVTPGDSSLDLDYASATAIELDDGDVIYRKSTNPSVEADTTLPEPSTTGSLSVNASLVVDTDAPTVQEVSATASANITAGDTATVTVRFGSAVVVTGKPQVYVDTGTVLALQGVVSIPTRGDIAFLKGVPGAGTAVSVQFALNFDLYPTDMVLLTMPGVEGANTTDGGTMVLSGTSSALFSGVWHADKHRLVLTAQEKVPKTETITLRVDGSNSLHVAETGILANSTGYTLAVQGVNGSIVATPLSRVPAVGITDVGVTYSGALAGEASRLTFTFTVPKALEENDTLIFSLPDFAFSRANTTDTVLLTGTSADSIVATWSSKLEELTMNFLDDTPAVNVSTNLSTTRVFSLATVHTFVLPPSGVMQDDVTVSILSANMGTSKALPVPSTGLAAVEVFSVILSPHIAGTEQELTIAWQLGPSSLDVGDTVHITLDSMSATVSTLFNLEFSTGEFSDIDAAASFNASLTSPSASSVMLSFEAQSRIAASTFVEVVVNSSNAISLSALGTEDGALTTLSTTLATGSASSVRFLDGADYSVVYSPRVVAFSGLSIAIEQPVSARNRTSLGDVVASGQLIPRVVAIVIRCTPSIAMEVGDSFTIALPDLDLEYPLFEPLTLNRTVDDDGGIANALNVTWNYVVEGVEITAVQSIAAGTEIIARLTEANNIVLSRRGILTREGYILSADADDFVSDANDVVPVTRCVGLCNATLALDDVRLDANTSVTVEILTDAVLQANTTSIVLRLPEMQKRRANLLVTSSTGTAEIEWDSAHNRANVSLTLITAPSKTLILTIDGLANPTTPYTSTPSVEVSSDRLMVYDVPIESTLSYPSTTYVGEFTRTALSYAPVQAGSVANVSVDFAVGIPLAVGDQVTILLPEFGGSDVSSLALKGPSSQELTAQWSGATTTLTLTAATAVAQGSNVSFTVLATNNITLPSDGIVANSSTLQLSTDAGVVTTTSIEDSPALGKVVSASVAIVNASVNSTAVTLRIAFETNLNLVAGDRVTVDLPGFSSTIGSSALDYSHENGLNVSWDDTAQQVVADVVESRLKTSYRFFVPERAGLQAAPYGILEGETFAVTVQSANAPYAIANAIGACHALCGASVTLSTAKAGFPTTIAVNVSATSFPLGSEVVLVLPGEFSNNVSASRSVSNMDLFGEDAAVTNATYHAPNGTIRFEITGANITDNRLEVETRRQNLIFVPDTGVPAGAQAEIYFYDGSLEQNFGPINVTLDAISKVLASRLTFSAASAAGDATNVSIALRYATALNSGDVISVFLPELEQSARATTDEPVFSEPANDALFTPTWSNDLTLLTLDVDTFIAANTWINVTFNDFFDLDSNGILPDATTPSVAVTAASGNSVASLFDAVGSVGAMQSSNVSFSPRIGGVAVQMQIQFRSALHALSRGDNITVSMPGFTVAGANAGETVPVAANVDIVNASFSGAWDVDAETLRLELRGASSGVISAGTSFTISIAASQNLTTPPEGAYANNVDLLFAIESASMSIAQRPFDAVDPLGLSASSVAFSDAVAGEKVSIAFSFSPSVDLQVNDTVTVTLPQFSGVGAGQTMTTHNNVSSFNAGFLVLTGTHSAQFTGNWSAAMETVTFVAQENVSANTAVQLSVTTASGNNLTAPARGLRGNHPAVTIELALESSGGSFNQSVQSVAPIGAVHAAEMRILNPVVGEPTALAFNFTLSDALEDGDKIVLSLASFVRESATGTRILSGRDASALSATGALTFSVSDEEQFAAPPRDTASSSSSSASGSVAPGSIYVVVESREGFQAPDEGITLEDTIAFTVTSSAVPFVAGTSHALSVATLVPYIESSAIAFEGVDSAQVYRTGGNTHALQLPPNHGFTTSVYAGVQFVLGTSLLTMRNISTLEGESDSVRTDASVAWVEESYSGPRIFMSSPNTSLFTPGFRPAVYTGGNGTTTLEFTYTVQVGDVSADLDIVNTSLVDFNGGSIKRLTDNPTTEVDTTLPLVGSGETIRDSARIVVETEKPRVLRVFTTSPNGVYGLGQVIDVQVRFSRPVSVRVLRGGDNTTVAPAILLDLGTAEPRPALFSEVMNTDTVTFSYTVRRGDTSLGMPFTHIQQPTEANEPSATNSSEWSPVRTVYGHTVAAIRRRGNTPVLDADVSVTELLAFQRSHNVTVKWDAIRTVNVTAVTSDGTYGAGEAIRLRVHFAAPVQLNTSAGSPYIFVNVVHTGGSVATAQYVGMSRDSMAVDFEYNVQSGDSTDGAALDLHCNCLDRLNTTYIVLNGSTIAGNTTAPMWTSAASTSNKVSVILPDPGASTSLASLSTVVVDTSTVVVTQVSTNATDLFDRDASATEPGSNRFGVGDAVSIFLHWSSPVYVYGEPKLRLSFADTFSLASFAGGNGTTATEFVYTIQEERGASNLDTADWLSLVLGQGGIKRASTNPTDDAVTTIPHPGARLSLGWQSGDQDMRIRTTAPAVTSVRADSAHYGSARRLRVQTLDFVDERHVVSGSFALTVGAVRTPSCIDVNVTAGGLAAALNAVPGVNVRVTEDDVRFSTFGRSLRITFVERLEAYPAIEITPFACSGTRFDAPSNAIALPVINGGVAWAAADAQDFVDLQVQFDDHVEYRGEPFLRLDDHDDDLSNGDTKHGAAASTSGGGGMMSPFAVGVPNHAVQTIDVGVTASSAISVGQYRLIFDGYRTNCIDWHAADSVAESSLRNRLQEIPSLARTPGGVQVSRTAVGYGYRFTVNLGDGAPLSQFEVYNGEGDEEDDEGDTVCEAFDVSDAVVTVRKTNVLRMRSWTQSRSGVRIPVNGTIPAHSSVELTIPASAGIRLPLYASLEANTAELSVRVPVDRARDSLVPSEAHVSAFSTVSHAAAPRATLATLDISTAHPLTNCSITATFAIDTALVAGDSIQILLPGFMRAPFSQLTSLTDLVLNGSSAASWTAQWQQEGGDENTLVEDTFNIGAGIETVFGAARRNTSALVLEVAASASVAAGERISLTVNSSNGLRTPAFAVYENSSLLSYSIVTQSHGTSARTSFVYSSAVGLVDAQLEFSSPAIGEQTNLSLALIPAYPLIPGDVVFVDLGERIFLESNTTVLQADVDVEGTEARYFRANFSEQTGELELKVLATVGPNRRADVDVVRHPYLFTLTLSGVLDKAPPTLAITATTTSKGTAARWGSGNRALTTSAFAAFPKIVRVVTSQLSYRVQDADAARGSASRPNAAAGMETYPVAGGIVAMDLIFSLDTNMSRHDVLTLALPGFTGCSRDTVRTRQASPKTLDVAWSEETETITLRAMRNIGAYETVNLTILASNGIQLPAMGVPVVDHGVTLAGELYSTHATSSILSPTEIEADPVGVFLGSEVQVSSAASGASTRLFLKWQLNEGVAAGSQVRFYLNGFNMPTNVTVNTTASASDADFAGTSVSVLERSATVFANVWWSSDDHILTLEAVSFAHLREYVLIVRAGAGGRIRLPTFVTHFRDNTYQVACDCERAPAAFARVITQPAPSLLHSAVSFSYPVGGASSEVVLRLALQYPLVPGDTFTLQVPNMTTTGAQRANASDISLATTVETEADVPSSLLLSTQFATNTSSYVVRALREVSPRVMDVRIAAHENITLPAAGLQRQSTAVLLSMDSDALGSFSASPVVTVGAIARLISAQVTLLSAATGLRTTHVNPGDAVSLAVDLDVSDSLILGDVIEMYLPDLEVASDLASSSRDRIALIANGSQSSALTAQWISDTYTAPSATDALDLPTLSLSSHTLQLKVESTVTSPLSFEVDAHDMEGNPALRVGAAGVDIERAGSAPTVRVHSSAVPLPVTPLVNVTCVGAIHDSSFVSTAADTLTPTGLSFSIRTTRLDAGAVLSWYLPGFRTNGSGTFDTDGETLILDVSLAGNNASAFTVAGTKWNNRTEILSFTLATAVESGAGLTFSIPKQVGGFVNPASGLVTNDPSVTVAVNGTECAVPAQSVHTVGRVGLAYATLTFNNDKSASLWPFDVFDETPQVAASSIAFTSVVEPGTSTEVELRFSLSGYLEDDELIEVHMPDFDLLGSGVSGGVTLGGPSASNFSATWNADNSELTLTIIPNEFYPNTPVVLTFDATLPVEGITSSSRDLSIRASGAFFTLNDTTFSSVDHTAALFDTSVTLSPSRLETLLDVVLGFEYSGSLFAYDTFLWMMPRLSGSTLEKVEIDADYTPTSTGVPTTARLQVSWDGCTHAMHVTVLPDDIEDASVGLETGVFALNVSAEAMGLYTSVSWPENSTEVSVASNATDGFIVDQIVDYVSPIGRFVNTAVNIHAPLAVGLPVNFSVSFNMPSGSLEVGDTVELRLPGFSRSGAADKSFFTPVVAETDTTSAVFRPVFNLSWESSTGNAPSLLLQPLESIPANTTVTLEINASIASPTTGLSASDHGITLSSTSAQAPVVNQPVESVTEVQVVYGSMEVRPLLFNEPVEVKLGFELSLPLDVGESVVFTLPALVLDDVDLRNAGNVSLDAGNHSVSGDLARTAFRANFNATWNTASSQLELVSLRSIPAYERRHVFAFNVFALDENVTTWRWDASAEDNDTRMSSPNSHTVHAKLAGGLNLPRHVLDEATLPSPACTSNLTWANANRDGGSVEGAAALSLQFSCSSDLLGGDELFLHLPGFAGPSTADASNPNSKTARTVEEIDVDWDDASLLSPAGVVALWVDGDFVVDEPVGYSCLFIDCAREVPTVTDVSSIESSRFVSSALYRHADTLEQSALRELPRPSSADSLAGSSEVFVEARDRVPVVERIYALMDTNHLPTGSRVDLHVEFSEPVDVFSPVSSSVDVSDLEPHQLPLLLMNTGRNASLITSLLPEAGGATTLHFAYVVEEQDMVDDFAPAGTGALWYGDASQSYIVASGTTRLLANTDLPLPLGSVNWQTGSPQPLALRGNESRAVVQALSYYRFGSATTSGGNCTFVAGDSLWIRVDFSRDVDVTGIPRLPLQLETGMRYAEYSVAAPEQVVLVGRSTVRGRKILAGEYTLSYGDFITTGCIDWDLAEASDESSEVRNSLDNSIGKSAETRLNEIAVEAGFGSIQVEREFRGYGNELRILFVDGAVKHALTLGDSSHCKPFELESEADGDDVHVESIVEVNPDSQSVAFEYVVREGDDTNGMALDVPANASIELVPVNQEAIDIAGAQVAVSADLSLPQPGARGSLSHGRALDRAVGLGIVGGLVRNGTCDVDTTVYNVTATALNESTRARVLELSTPTADGLYAPGEEIYIDMRFSSAVTVDGIDAVDVEAGLDWMEQIAMASSPALQTQASLSVWNEVSRNASAVVPYLIMNTNLSAVYVSGSGTDTLRFLYRVASYDNVHRLNVDSSNALKLQDGVSLIGADGRVANRTLFPAGQDLRSFNYSHAIELSSEVPTVVKVDAVNADGTYYPGDLLDIYVQFTLPVSIVEATATATGVPEGPTLELFVFSRPTAFATYVSGNGTTELHFEYEVPMPSTRLALDAPYVGNLDYAGTEALRRHLPANTRLKRTSTHPSTPVDASLPIQSKSYISRDRHIMLNHVVPKVSSVYCLQEDGSYGAGAVLDIAVEFTESVTVSGGTPSLMMDLGVEHVEAPMVSGNNSDTLVFRFEVTVGHTSSSLDYVDTRNAPYSQSTIRKSLALVVTTANPRVRTFVAEPGRDLVTIRKSATTPMVDAKVTLPLPGAENSLSANADIVIDTTSPSILSVATDIPDGTYREGDVIPVLVTFENPVTVYGCPVVSLAVRPGDGAAAIGYAWYVSGTGTSTLRFEYLVDESDSAVNLNYVSTSSLFFFRALDRLFQNSCGDAASVTDVPNTESSTGAIRRTSTTPTVNADMTLPELERATIVEPTSLVSGGHSINLTSTAPYVSRVALYPDRSGTGRAARYTVGEQLTVHVTFNEPVAVRDTATPSTLTLALNIVDSDTDGVARYAGSVTGSDRTLIFTYVVGTRDSDSGSDSDSGEEELDVANSTALVSTTNCAVYGWVDSDPTQDIECASLVLPAGSSAGNSLAAVSVANVEASADVYVEPSRVTLVGLPGASAASSAASASMMESVSTVRAGDLVYVAVTFSDFVTVVGGTPSVNLALGNSQFSTLYSAPYVSGSGSDTLYFEFQVQEGMLTNQVDAWMETSGSAGAGTVPTFVTSLSSDALSPSASLMDMFQCDGEFAMQMNGAALYATASAAVLDVDTTLPCPTHTGGILETSPLTAVETDAPTVARIWSRTENTVLFAGDTVQILVEFDAPVVVTGSPRLWLDLTGDANAYASFLGMDAFADAADTTLEFSYTVPTDAGSTSAVVATSDLEQLSAAALELPSGAWIQRKLLSPATAASHAYHYATQRATTESILARGDDESLGVNHNFVVDLAVPHVTNVTCDYTFGLANASSFTSSGAPELGAGHLLNITIVFSESVVLEDDIVDTLNVSFLDSNGSVFNTSSGRAVGDVVVDDAGAPVLYLQTRPSDTTVEPPYGVADLTSAAGNELHFAYIVQPDDGTTTLDVYNATALRLRGHRVVAAADGADVRTLLPTSASALSSGDALPSQCGVVVDTSAPVVLEVRSLDPALVHGYAAGDTLRFDVEFDKTVVVVNNGVPILELNSGGNATYVSGSGTRVLRFEYLIQEGENSADLDYVDEFSLTSSDIMREATFPVTQAVLTLVPPSTLGSISAKTRLLVDTTAPYVSRVFPLKSPGTYIDGDTIPVVVRFSRPVTVTGSPLLGLRVVPKADTETIQGGDVDSEAAESSVVYAPYMTNFSVPDVSFRPLDTDVMFEYSVNLTHFSSALIHASKDSLQLNGASILRTSEIPTTAVNTTLRTPGDNALESGTLDGQWVASFPQRVEVVVRDLWHEHAEDLELVLWHGNHSAVLVSQCCNDRTYGRSFVSRATPVHSVRTDAESQRERRLSGLGYDYVFSDGAVANIALTGAATQSTTAFGGVASRAIDGNTDGYFARGSVTHTGGHGVDDPQPWWQVRLAEIDVAVGTVVLWNREQQDPGPENDAYSWEAPRPEYTAALFPCTVSVVNAAGHVVFSRTLTEERHVTNIVLPIVAMAQYVRVQLLGHYFLSIAEVQVYPERLPFLADYDAGSPIDPRGVTYPYKPEEPLADTFDLSSTTGEWILAVRDYTTVSDKAEHGARNTGKVQEINGLGKLSEWTLVITDFANIVSTYYMDVTTEVTTLPKYGDLHVPDTTYAVTSWDYLYGTAGDALATADGLQRQLAPCYGVDTTGMNGVQSPRDIYRSCGDNFGVAPLGTSQKDGAKPVTNFYRGERVLFYRPFETYLGTDSFTYLTRIGTRAAASESRVNIEVHLCRPFVAAEDIASSTGTDAQTPHTLCDCARTEFHIFGNVASCLPAVQATCSSPLAIMFNAMCNACADGMASSNFADFSPHCHEEITRATVLARERGMCAAIGKPNCQHELVAKPAPEPFIFYPGATVWSDLSPLSNSNPGQAFATTPQLA